MPQARQKHVHLSAARLFAVQAVYQMIKNDNTATQAAYDFLNYHIPNAIHQESDLAEPDKEHFSKIVQGSENREDDLILIVSAAYKEQNDVAVITKMKQSEPLLYAILLCGSYELLAHQDVDAPVIIDDYLNVAHAFFERGEVKLINATLDKIARSVRG